MSRLLTVILAGGLVGDCAEEQLIAPSAMPVSENGVFTDDGRFVVVCDDTFVTRW